jgi:16S rRNA (cytosine1402-N4)-methyltransferase
MEYHRPVLLDESIEGLRIQPSGIYCDVTFGGGGHSKSILSQLDDKGHLFAFDQDEDAARNLLHDRRFTFVRSNFRYLWRFMRYYAVPALDGVLADLGVSSFQFDNPERGFSYRGDQPMDMRMNTQQSITAADILQQYAQEQLVSLFSNYGQVRNARTLAAHICEGRGTYQLSTVAGFLDCIAPCIRGNRMRYLAQVFQSLRIEVNEEMDSLVEMLGQATEMLVPGGRLVVISYHSVEDQIVKRWMKFGNVRAGGQQEAHDAEANVLQPVTKKPVVPTEEEIAENPRARSAKLRIAEKQNSK